MPRWRVLAPFCLLLAALLAAPTASTAQTIPAAATTPEPGVELPVTADDGSVRGTLAIEVREGAGPPLLLTLALEGLTPAARYEVHLRAGPPERPSTSFGWLGTLDAGGDGSGTLRTTTLGISGSFALEELTLEPLADGPHLVEVVGPDGRVAARAIVPALPIGLGSGAASFGIPAVDAVLAAVARGDAAPLLARTALTEVPCGPESPEGFALVPTCAGGEAEGTPVPVLPVAACEGVWVRDPRPVLDAFVEHAGELHAVVRGPEPASADAWRPTADHVVVFAAQPGSIVPGLAVSLRGGAVVAVEMGCRGPADLLLAPDGTPLPGVAPVGQPARATIDVFSGRADNPAWALSATQAVTLQSTLAALPATAEPVPEQGLGYRGFVLEVPADDGGPARRVRVHAGLAWDEDAPEAWRRRDPDRRLERWLAATAPTTVPPEIMALVQAELARP